MSRSTVEEAKEFRRGMEDASCGRYGGTGANLLYLTGWRRGVMERLETIENTLLAKEEHEMEQQESND